MISCRADFFTRLEQRDRRSIKIYYETISQESASNGESESSGLHEERGYTNGTPEQNVDWAINEFGPYMPLEYSDSNPNEHSFSNDHDWYKTIDAELNDDGSETYYSLHLKGFTPAEKRSIYDKVMGK